VRPGHAPGYTTALVIGVRQRQDHGHSHEPNGAMAMNEIGPWP